jgi:hypothetical protein
MNTNPDQGYEPEITRVGDERVDEKVSDKTSDFQSNDDDFVYETQTINTDFELDLPSSSSEENKSKWLIFGENISKYLDKSPQYAKDFFEAYKRPLIIIIFGLVTVITLKITSGLLDVINEIPLVAPSFEVIGIGSTIWFIFRYLISSQKRQELLEKLENIKEYVLGDNQEL